jgi:hypothetical protein
VSVRATRAGWTLRGSTVRPGSARPAPGGTAACGLAPRITAELNDGAPPGARINHKRVARVHRLPGGGQVLRDQAVDDHRHAFEVKRLCDIVEIARSSFRLPG